MLPTAAEIAAFLSDQQPTPQEIASAGRHVERLSSTTKLILAIAAYHKDAYQALPENGTSVQLLRALAEAFAAHELQMI